MIESIREKLDRIEGKLDAVLVLGLLATNHDDFACTLTGKSPQYIEAIRRATAVAARVAIELGSKPPTAEAEVTPSPVPSSPE